VEIVNPNVWIENFHNSNGHCPQLKKGIEMKKQLKKHLYNSEANRYFCGKSINSNDISIDCDSKTYYDGKTIHPITIELLDMVCTSCFKLAYPELYQELIHKKEVNRIKQSIPKGNRAKLNSKPQFKSKRYVGNVIQLPWIPVPITDPALLIDYKPAKSNSNPKSNPIPNKPVNSSPKPNRDSIKAHNQALKNNPTIKHAKTKSIDNSGIRRETIVEFKYKSNPNVNTEDAFIRFDNELAMVRGFGNNWMVVLNSNGITESITEWIPFKNALAEVVSLGGLKTAIK
jgi:hypothetical protein